MCSIKAFPPPDSRIDGNGAFLVFLPCAIDILIRGADDQFIVFTKKRDVSYGARSLWDDYSRKTVLTPVVNRQFPTTGD
jgi:hypothetical protein